MNCVSSTVCETIFSIAEYYFPNIAARYCYFELNFLFFYPPVGETRQTNTANNSCCATVFRFENVSAAIERRDASTYNVYTLHRRGWKGGGWRWWWYWMCSHTDAYTECTFIALRTHTHNTSGACRNIYIGNDRNNVLGVGTNGAATGTSWTTWWTFLCVSCFSESEV